MTMTTEQSKPIALDERDAHLFFCMFGRYEPAVALGIIVMLSVWALFIILHRTVRGQRRKKDEIPTETEVKAVEEMTIKEQRHSHADSTVSENLGEEVSKAQDSIGGHGGVVSLPRDPGLCEGALDELSCPVIGEYQASAGPESHDQVEACWDIPQEHKSNHSTDVGAHSVPADHNKHVSLFHQREHQEDQTKNQEELHDRRTHHGQIRNHKDHVSEDPKSLQEIASTIEVESNQHQHLSDKIESPLDHFDHDIETENKEEFLYANLNSQPDQTSEQMRLSVMEDTIKNSHDCFDGNPQISSQQNDLLNSAGNSSAFQKKIQGQEKCQPVETCRIAEINVMETLKSHPGVLTDYQHLRGHCKDLSNLHYHGLLSGHHERENDHRPPSRELSGADAPGARSEGTMKTLSCSMTQPPVDNPDRTEISIMEATMDYNEWMNGGTTEINKLVGSSGKTPMRTVGLGDGGVAEQCPQKSADGNLATISLTQESGTTVTLFDGDPAIKRAEAIHPAPQTVAVSFCVHYITHSPLQLLAVTGNQQELGDWEKFVPLKGTQDGFWVNSVPLRTDRHVEWKFVVVEEGRICRWEECSNRQLQTGYEEAIHLHKCWGCA